MSAPPSPVRSSGVRRKAATPDPLGRPRLRGWLHLNGAVVAVVCSAVLIPLAATVSGLAVAAAAVYAFGVSACFGISALYHRR
ncbi:MAG: hemolysin III family protein, partial [Micromonosporaceae bacterium]